MQGILLLIRYFEREFLKSFKKVNFIFYLNRMSLISHSYVIRMRLVCIRMSFVCHSYVLLCHPYVTRMYSYVIRTSLVGTRMSFVCHSYVLVCHPYVTRMYSYATHMRFYHESLCFYILLDFKCFNVASISQIM